MPTVEVSMGAGRTLDQKRQLVKGITSAVSKALSVPEEAVTIILRESTDANWANGGKLKCDSVPGKPAAK